MDLNKAELLAKRLMLKHGLLGYQFGWTNSKRVFGQQQGRTIKLSKPLTEANDEDQVIDTILHEIAHGLTQGHGHDKLWKAACIRIGANPERIGEGNMIPRKWMANCECGIFLRHRRISGSCGRCKKELVWTKNIHNY